MTVDLRPNGEAPVARLAYLTSRLPLAVVLSAIILVAMNSLPALADPTAERSPSAEVAQAIRLTNYSNGDVIRYPVALLTGELKDVDVKSISLTNRDSTLPSKQMTGLAFRG